MSVWKIALGVFIGVAAVLLVLAVIDWNQARELEETRRIFSEIGSGLNN